MVSDNVIRHRRMALTMSSSCANTMLQAAFFFFAFLVLQAGRRFGCREGWEDEN